MAVTKLGYELNKKASVTALTLGGLHVGQNALVKNRLGSSYLHKKLLDSFRSGEMSGSKTMGAAGALLPEHTIFEREFRNLGRSFFKNLKEKGIDPKDLTKRDYVIIRNFLRGDLQKGINRDPKRAEQLLEAMSGSLPGDMGHATKYITSKGGSGLKELEGVYKTNPITGKLLKGVGDQLGKVTKKADPSTKAQRITRGITTGTAGIGITALDPVTGVVNIGKRALSSPYMQKLRPTAYIQNKSNELLLTKPVSKSFYRGLDGKKESVSGAGNMARDYFLNPVINQSRNLAQGIGRVAKDQGLDRQKLQKMKELHTKAKTTAADPNTALMANKVEMRGRLAANKLKNFT